MNHQRYWNMQGLVLKHYTSGENDRRVMFFMKELGKVTAKARGAKKLTSPFTSRLLPMNLCQVLLYKTPQNTWTVTQCQTLNVFENLKKDLDKATIGLAIVEIIHRCTQQYHANDGLFDLSMETLETLQILTKKNQIDFLFQIFQIKTLDLLGVLPSFSACSHCHQKINIDTLEGWHPLEILCENCASQKKNSQEHLRLFEKNYLKLLHFLRQKTMEESLKITLEPKQQKEFNQILRMFWAQQSFSLPKSVGALESLRA